MRVITTGAIGLTLLDIILRLGRDLYIRQRGNSHELTNYHLRRSMDGHEFRDAAFARIHTTRSLSSTS